MAVFSIENWATVALVTVCSLWFQLSDCFQGVVFDSLETLFARNVAVALLCLLKAIGNQDHIYVVNMAQDYTAMKAQEKAKKEQEGRASCPPGLSLWQSCGLCEMLPLQDDPLGRGHCSLCHVVRAHLCPVRCLADRGDLLRDNRMRDEPSWLFS